MSAGTNGTPGSPEDRAARALLRPLGVDGVYARTALSEEVHERLAAAISGHREDGAEILRFPPVMSRQQVEHSGYLKSFPNLLGCVSSLQGGDAEIAAVMQSHEAGADWATSLAPADLVLTPAACYPVYPLAAARGPVPDEGWHFDVAADCFRREPSRALDRLQSFRMREFVHVGAPSQVLAFRDRWLERVSLIAESLALPHRLVRASDPFFGRTGKVRGIAQLQQSLKFELVVPLRSEADATACMSVNYHQDHFGKAWELRQSAGVAHSACVAFGMDRLVLALFWQHGSDPERWPDRTRATLQLG